MICDIKKEYSDKFDELRKARVEMSYYKYGPRRRTLDSTMWMPSALCRSASRNTMRPETPSICATQRTTACLSLCFPATRKHISDPQTAGRAPGSLE